MKAMKKLWTTLCVSVFALAFGFGIALQTNVTAKAATAQDLNLTWAAIQYEGDTPTRYAFVPQDGITTPENYTFSVYFDGKVVPAYTVAGHNLIYVDYASFPSDVNDVHLFKMPAGTYYQSGEYTSADCTLLLKNAGWNNGLDKFEILTYDVVSEEAFDLGLYMEDWALGGNTNAQLYIATNDGGALAYAEDWMVSYNTLGNTVKINGNYVERWITQLAEGQAYMPFEGVSDAGDTVTIDGWFYNADQNKAFRAEEVTFKFDGQAWSEVGTPEYDLVLSTTNNGGDANGIYASMAANDIPVSGWDYQTKACGGKGILYNGSPLDTCLQKWSVGDWYVNLSAVGVSAKAGDVVTVFGWFFCNGDGSSQWHIKINPTTFTFDGSSWSQESPAISVNVNGTAAESNYLYVMPGETTDAIDATASGSILTDTTVTTVYENGAVEDGQFVLRNGESSSAYSVTFSVKDKNNVVYKKEMVVRVGFEDFVMENGASVRVLQNGESTEANGLRFIAELSKDTYENLKAQNASFGMVIVPRDYITDGYELTVNNLFGVNAKYSETAALGATQTIRRMTNIKELAAADKDGDGRYELYGAIRNILEKNLTREYVGVAYVYVNGTYILASYYGNDIENNSRSIYYVSQKAIDANDKYSAAVQTAYIDAYNGYLAELGATYKTTYTVNYIKTANGKTETETKTVDSTLNTTVTLNAEEFDGYTLTSASTIVAKLYANKPNVFNFYYKDNSAPSYDSVAWYYPTLDSSNGYDNATNNAIAQTMKDAGFTMVNLAGVGSLNLNSEANIEATKQIIAMFYRNGLQSVVYTSNAQDGEMFGGSTLPDFSDCAGFAGFLVWDEPLPTTAAMNRLAEYAAWYNSVYGASETPFMVNLFPSYAPCFENATGDYKTYVDYIKAYCDMILSQVNGTKYLSTDSYPIMADGTLKANFLYDLAVLKAYGLEYDAFVHACLQASGWDEGNTTQSVAPTEEQMRLQLYTALAFGMDSVSWFSYEPLNNTITDQSPVNFDGTKNEAVYNAMQAVNADLAAFGSLYKTYDWKGVIMSSPAKGTSIFGYYINQDPQYNAYDRVKSESLFAKYLLSASNTKAFSSVSGSGNYIVGVMEDENGNEAFTVVNYSAPKDSKAVALTLKGVESAKYTVYIDGVAQEVEIGASGYTLNLQPGQGAFIVAANTEHTVTFENWDGSVLQSGKVAYGETPVYEGETPTRDGYKFAGWTPTITEVTKDATYTATFKKIYTVTFVNYDGSVIETKTVADGAAVEPITVTHDTYIFKAWTLDGVAYDFNAAVTEDITLVATWQIRTAITPTTEVIVANASTVMADGREVAIRGDNGVALTLTGAAAEDGVYSYGFTMPQVDYRVYSEVSFITIFGQQYGAYNFSAYGTSLANISATWNFVKVIYVGAEGKTVKNTDTGADIVLGEGYYFTAGNTDVGAEWYKYVKLPDAVVNGSEALTFNVITPHSWDWMAIRESGASNANNIVGMRAFAFEDLTESTITFTNMVGTDIVKSVFAGNTVEQPADPTREGYVFSGWYTEDGEVFDFNTEITQDTTIVAKWLVRTAITATTETVVANASTTLAPALGTGSYGEYTSALVLTGATAVNGTYSYALTMPKINYNVYSEVSFITVFGQQSGTYTFSAYGTNFVNTSAVWNWGKIIYVGAEGKTVKDTDTGADLVLGEGYYLTFGNVDVGAEWYKYVKLSDAVVNGEETLTFNIATPHSWDWMAIRESGASNANQIVGTRAFGFEDATTCNLTESSTVDEYVAYMRKVNGFTAYEKANYEEPAIVATLRAKYAGTSITLVSGLNTAIETNAAVDASWGHTLTGAGDNTYTFAMPKLEYFLYSEVACIAVFGGANTYTITAYGTTFVNLGANWNWVKVVKVGAEGKTVKDTDTGADIVLAEGYYLTIGNTDTPDIWYKYAKLSDSVVNGEEALTFTVVTQGNWDYLNYRQDGGTETDNFVGKLA